MGNAPSHQGAGGILAQPAQADQPTTASPQTVTSRSKSKDERPPPPSSPPPPQTPLLMPFAGHLSPQNPHALSHPQAHDYSKTVVTQLILDQQLAPFYRGLEDWEDDWTESDVHRILDEVREKDLADEVDNSYTARLKEDREIVAKGKGLKLEAERAERTRREGRAYLGAVECPICFLYYPPNINTSRCCQQPLCTECFVQIKRSEATTTHLESDAACCPFCVETEFGVIYERPTAPPTPMGMTSPMERAMSPESALATSPDAGQSAFSAMSMSEDAGTSGFSARQQGPRRKSVSSKAKEVVTIDEIRPDWEDKLNAVKAAAARRAARRIVMRQVGDRLVPIGYTSSRATGQADFSMSIPEEGRRSRRTRERDREREMEEMMIMEAMRLSLLDHEDHQKRMHDDARGGGSGRRSGAGTPTPTSSRRSSSAAGTLNAWRNSQESGGGGRAQAAASKLLSKITVNRSRANSKSSVHFAPSPTTLGPNGASNGGGSGSSTGRARASSTPSPNPNPMVSEHTASPLGATVTTRRSLDIAPSAPVSAQALAAAIANTDRDSPLARDLADAADECLPDPAEAMAHVEPPHLDEPAFDQPTDHAMPDLPDHDTVSEPEQMGGNLIALDSASSLNAMNERADPMAAASGLPTAAAPGFAPDGPIPSTDTTPPAMPTIPSEPIPSIAINTPRAVEHRLPTLDTAVSASSELSTDSAGVLEDDVVRRPSQPLAARADTE